MKMLPMSSKIICHYSLALNIEIEEKNVLLSRLQVTYMFIGDCTYQELKKIKIKKYKANQKCFCRNHQMENVKAN